MGARKRKSNQAYAEVQRLLKVPDTKVLRSKPVAQEDEFYQKDCGLSFFFFELKPFLEISSMKANFFAFCMEDLYILTRVFYILSSCLT